MFDIYEIFEEYDTNNVVVTDFGIISNGCLVTNLVKTENGDIQIWAGDPDNKFSEELVLSKAERKRVFEEVLELL